MRIFHISGDQFTELDALPEALPAKGYLWVGSARREFEVHTLDLHGARLVTPRQRPQDIWHDLTSFEACVALAADRATGKSN